MLYVCVSQRNTCLIGGNCYAAEEVNPWNPAEICDPKQNMTAWTGKLFSRQLSASFYMPQHVLVSSTSVTKLMNRSLNG